MLLEETKKEELTPNQARQILKQQRKKKYADLAIQGTNNSSIASKRSVELLYLPKLDINRDTNRECPNREYFKYFVPKSPKRSPCINRGYWLRLYSIRSRLQSILEQNLGSGKEILVINLGCGFDPLPFQLLDKQNIDSEKFREMFLFLDIDYPTLIAEKVRMINAEPELLKIVGFDESNAVNSDSTPSFISNRYKALSCNLNDATAFEALLKNNEKVLDPNVIKVFIAEVSLAYMKSEHSDEIISIASNNSPNSHFLILEQLIPEGEFEPFSKQMLKHFKKNDSPLQSVLTYHTMESQIKRFKGLGYSKVNAGSMLQLWESVPTAIQTQVEDIELFDELEEFHLFCHHYLLLHATNNNDFEFVKPYLFTMPEAVPLLEKSDNISIMSLDTNINRRFGGGILEDETKAFYFGGANPARLNESIKLDTNEDCIFTKVTEQTNIPKGRMCHTINKTKNDKYFVIGGRSAPGYGFNEVYTYNSNSRIWKLEEQLTLPESRYRHNSMNVSPSTLLVFGGVTTSTAPFILVDMETNTIKECTIEYKEGIEHKIEQLVSAAVAYNENTNQGVIIGGSFDSQHQISNNLIHFQLDQTTIKVLSVVSNPLFQRYGGKACYIDINEILIIGGTSNTRLFNQNTNIIKYNIKEQQFTSIQIPSNIWENNPLCLIGFELLHQDNKIYILGGGATCYGFGSISNNNMTITIN